MAELGLDNLLTDMKKQYYANKAEESKDIKPVSLKKFLYSKEYLNIPFVLGPRQYQFMLAMDEDKPRNCKYNEAILAWGKGSGKDNLVALYFARRAYKLLCMADPHGHFKSQSFELLNVAASEDQAKGVFFKYLADTFKNAGDKAFRVFGFDPEKDILSNKIRLPKNITCVSGHSNASSLEGNNLYCAVLDEVAEFKTEEEIAGKGRHAAMSAGAIYKLCRSSINTRFPKCGKLILISFPRFKKDFIMTKYYAGLKRPNVYCDKGATFEINPTKKESDFEYDLINEPEFTRTAIYCDPPHAKDAFITQVQFIDRIVNDKIVSPYKKGIEGPYKEQFRGTKGNNHKYVIACDLALSSDRASLTMGHREIVGGRPLYIIDLIKTWKAEKGGIIRLKDIYNEIIVLRYRGFNIVQINFDQFASAQMIQDLIEQDFQAQKQSVDRNLDPYLALRNIIYQESLLAYRHPLLLQELKELQLINGVKVDHPSHGSKDVADSTCSCIYTLSTMPEYSNSGSVNIF